MQKDGMGPVYAAGMEGLRAYWEILRPFNGAMAAAAAIIGLAIAGGLAPCATALIFLAVFLVTGAGNAVNDYCDRQIDAVNRPGRPIPSGRISPRAALYYSMALFAAGSLLAGLVNSVCLLLAVFNSALLILYARSL
ncbi:MAG TPA: UbiA family prenyltransferase, partial [Methanothrix sp.]|nr:UbiA family prenyltransferase [Methanothrix sp.]